MRWVTLLIVYGTVELVLLLVLADHMTWQFALSEILLSGILGLAVIRYVTSQYGRRIISRLTAQEFPGDTLAHGAILFIAGVLLMLPGPLGDAIGLLLLLPPVRWLVIAHLRRRYMARMDTFKARFVHTNLTDDSPDTSMTLDCDHSPNDARGPDE